MSRKIKEIVVASCIGLLTSIPANAATVTLAGTNFDLSYDDATVGGSTGFGLYGVPDYGLSSGNTITFNQTGFNVTSTDGDNILDTLASTISFTLTRHNSSFNFESLSLFEFGTYTLNGPGTSVNVTGSMSVSTPTGGITGDQVNPLPQISATSDLTINDSGAHNWFGGASADLTTGSNGFGIPNTWADENSILISINNILEANTTQAGTSAFIQKLQAATAVQLGVNGSPASAVPVPAAVWLMISGLLGLFGIARRK